MKYNTDKMLNVIKNAQKCDNYTTPKSAYMDIKKFIAENITIYDPFYNDGGCQSYMKEVFGNNKIIHLNEEIDLTKKSNQEFDMIITNPPFTIKKRVLEWLVAQGKPFMCISPLNYISTVEIRKIPCFEDFQFILPNRRINFEREGKEHKGSWFPSVWICYKMELPEKIVFN